jgi:hypothetical protein
MQNENYIRALYWQYEQAAIYRRIGEIREGYRLLSDARRNKEITLLQQHHNVAYKNARAYANAYRAETLSQ